jgi:hypothetical protein
MHVVVTQVPDVVVLFHPSLSSCCSNFKCIMMLMLILTFGTFLEWKYILYCMHLRVVLIHLWVETVYFVVWKLL